jgi:MFS transporter, DHA1 family, multidrug resistance protein
MRISMATILHRSKTMSVPASRFRAVLLVSLVAFTALSIDIVIPVLPMVAREFATTPATAQLALGVFILTFAVCQLFYGPLSDRYGRRPIILFGVALYVVASVFCFFAASVEQLLFGRALQAMGAGAGPAIARAMVRDLYGREQAARMLARMGMAMGLIPAVAPILGGFLAEGFGWRAVFAVLLGFGALAFAGALFRLPETNTRRDAAALRPAALAQGYAALACDRGFMAYTLAGALLYCAMFAFHSLAPFVFAERLGLGATAFAFYFALVVGAYIAGNFASTRIVPRVGLDGAIARGLGLAVLGGLVMLGLHAAGIEHAMALVGPAMAVTFAGGLVFPNATAAALAPHPERAGAASALMGFTTFLLGAGFGAGLAAWHDGSARALAAGVAVAAVSAALGYAVLRRRRPTLVAAE